MNAVGGCGREAVVRYLARHAASWLVLHAYRHRGLGAAAEALGTCGGVGRDDDGVFRCWFTEAGGRRLTYRQGSTTSPIVRVPLRQVLDFADRRLTAAEWHHIDRLVSVRGAAIADAYPRNHSRSPAQRSDAENARITAGRRAKATAERELRAIITAALADRPRPGDQLDLFVEGAADWASREP